MTNATLACHITSPKTPRHYLQPPHTSLPPAPTHLTTSSPHTFHYPQPPHTSLPPAPHTPHYLQPLHVSLTPAPTHLTTPNLPTHLTITPNLHTPHYPHEGVSSWSPSINNYYQHVEVSLPSVMRVTQLALQGKQNSDEYVLEFLLQYSTDGDSWMLYKNSGGVEEVWRRLLLRHDCCHVYHYFTCVN